MIRYRDDLRAVRRFTAGWAAQARLPDERSRDLMAAVSELAANTLAHTDSEGTLTISLSSSEIICEVRDSGWITDPEPGLVRPDPASPDGKRGLWLVRELTDAMEVASGPSGTVTRIRMRRPAAT